MNSVCVCFRDDLYRVELDHVTGDEMFYSKVSHISSHTHTHARWLINMCMCVCSIVWMCERTTFSFFHYYRSERGNPIRMTSESAGWRANMRWVLNNQRQTLLSASKDVSQCRRKVSQCISTLWVLYLPLWQIPLKCLSEYAAQLYSTHSGELNFWCINWCWYAAVVSISFFFLANWPVLLMLMSLKASGREVSYLTGSGNFINWKKWEIGKYACSLEWGLKVW